MYCPVAMASKATPRASKVTCDNTFLFLLPPIPPASSVLLLNDQLLSPHPFVVSHVSWVNNLTLTEPDLACHLYLSDLAWAQLGWSFLPHSPPRLSGVFFPRQLLAVLWLVWIVAAKSPLPCLDIMGHCSLCASHLVTL